MSSADDALLRDTADRKRAERLAADLLEAAPDAMVAVDAAGAIVLVNSQVERMFGWARGDLIGKPVETLVPERFRGAHTGHRAAYAAAPRAREMGSRLPLFGLRRDGTEFPVEIRLSPIDAPGGTLVISAIRDVTDRKRLEKERDEAAARYAQLVGRMDQGVCVTDARNRFVFVNEPFARMLGYEPAELLGKTHVDVVPAEELEHDRRIGARLRSGVAESADVTVVRSDGARRRAAFDAVPFLDGAGAYAGLFAIVTDVTDRRRTEEALARSERNFRLLVERFSEPVFVHRDGSLVYVNPAFLAWYGEERADALLGRHVLDVFVHPDERARVGARTREVASGAPAAIFEVRLVRRDGAVRTMETSAVRCDFDGALANVVVARDVTDLRQTQARLVLSDRLASVGTLAAGMAHEINNPLAYVVSNLELIAEEARSMAAASPSGALRELTDLVSEARHGAERVRKIVRGMRAFSRADEDRPVLLDVRSVADASIHMAYNEMRHRARLVKDFGHVPPVVADEARLGQVLINLLVNAAHAIPEGDAAKNEIRIVTRTDSEGRAVLEVHDTGRGIPPEALPRIFDPFFTTKGIGEGTGLGLAICHGIVSGLGGEIAAASEPGKGSVFRVVLPAAAADSERMPSKQPSAKPAPVRRGRVLVVDDDPIVGSSLKRVLSKDHDVTVAVSGKDALDRIASAGPFDAILCDLMMPDTSGMALYAELRTRMPETCDRIVFMTGGAFTPAARAFLDEVDNARIEKPFAMENVRAIVNAVVRSVASEAPPPKTSPPPGG